MKAMILAAGVGSRLDPLTRSVPKPMVPIVNRPVMEYLLELLKQHGFHEIMVNTHYLGDRIESYFGDGSKWDVPIHWSREEMLWGDAGSVKRVADFFKDDTFLVIGGDDLTDMDLTAVVHTHKSKGATATLALSIVEDPSEYGIVQLDENGRITRFLEKPKGEVFSNTANTGVYVFEPDVLDIIPAHTFFLFGKQLFPRLMERGMPMYGHVTEAYWKDVGNLGIYRQAQSDVLEGRVNAMIPLRQERAGIWIGENVTIDPTAEIQAPVAIGSGVTIGPHARVLENSIIGDRCHIQEGATVQGSILWEGVTVKSGTHLERCVVGKEREIQTNGAVFDGLIFDPTRPPAPISAG